VSDITGKSLAETLLDILNNVDEPLSHCRGQAHDNGEDCILPENTNVRYYPRCAHSLNPAVSDSAKSSVIALLLIGVLQRLYTLFLTLKTLIYEGTNAMKP
jgi:hypothetical protein